MKLEHVYVRVNDGKPRYCTEIDAAINEAVLRWHDEVHEWEWDTITLRSLPCDNREPGAEGTHYPNTCWHYAVTIEKEEEPNVDVG